MRRSLCAADQRDIFPLLTRIRHCVCTNIFFHILVNEDHTNNRHAKLALRIWGGNSGTNHALHELILNSVGLNGVDSGGETPCVDSTEQISRNHNEAGISLTSRNLTLPC